MMHSTCHDSTCRDKLPSIGIERTERERQYILAGNIFFFLFLVLSNIFKMNVLIFG